MTSSPGPRIARAAALCVALSLSPAHAAETALIGSGATFPAPLYTQWFQDYAVTHPGLALDYLPKSGAAAMQDFVGGMVDFAASDQALTDAELAQIKRGLVLLPMAAGAVALAYKLPGISTLRLPRDVLADIALGTLSRWNDPRIAAANKGAKLPNLPIVRVSRGDPSWTTQALARHLAAVSPGLRPQPDGSPWAGGEGQVAATGDAGVIATLGNTPGALGYLDLRAARQAKVQTALVQNRAGKFVGADARAASAALSAAEIPAGNLPGGEAPDLRAGVADPAGPGAYPIVAFTWLLLYAEQDDTKAQVLRDLVAYGLTQGQTTADALGYIPLPKPLINQVRAAAQFVQ